jgi:hypothetical protein
VVDLLPGKFGFAPEFHARGAEVIQHRYQVAKAAAQSVEFPYDQRVAVFEFLQTAGRFVVAPDKPSSLKMVLHPAFLRAASCRAGLWSSVDTRPQPYFMMLGPPSFAEEAAKNGGCRQDCPPHIVRVNV